MNRKWWTCVCGYVADWFIAVEPLGGRGLIQQALPDKEFVCTFFLSLAEVNETILDETPHNTPTPRWEGDTVRPKCLITIQLTSLGSDHTDTLHVPTRHRVCACVCVSVVDLQIECFPGFNIICPNWCLLFSNYVAIIKWILNGVRCRQVWRMDLQAEPLSSDSHHRNGWFIWF